MAQQNPVNNRKQRQKRGIWITVASVVAVMVLFLGLFLNKMNTPRALSNAELKANGAYLFDQPRTIEEFALTNHRGEPFTLEDFKGQWTIAFFGFTHCPDICPTTLATLARVYDALDPEIREQTQVVMVSVDPARDTPEKLAEYITFFDDSFVGVTGDFQQLMRLTRQLNVAFRKVTQGDDYTIDHSANMVLIDPAGHYRAFYRPPFELARLKLVHQSIVSTQ